jgi:repressor LexA
MIDQPTGGAAALTRTQAAVLQFLADEIEATGVCPTYREMTEAIRLSSPSNAHRIVWTLHRKGYLRVTSGRDFSIEILHRGASANPFRMALEAVVDADRRGDAHELTRAIAGARRVLETGGPTR